MSDSSNVILMLAALVCAFCMGRWTTFGSSPVRVGPGLTKLDQEVEHDLYSPPLGHAKVVVPSVVRDVRGEVHNLNIGGYRFNVLVSRAGWCSACRPPPCRLPTSRPAVCPFHPAALPPAIC